ncbi:MAG: 30S ribosomal protein S4 [Candidatus Diapherotrites archaeon]|nr:30S ribosomal protein S4 [Candidatus Diapherotrites archaeon]
MGDPGKLRRKYVTPRKAWDKERIVSEKKIVQGFGLKNKKELWRAEAYIGKARGIARDLLARTDEESDFRETELMTSLQRRALIQEGASLDNVLALNVEDILERRLQTQVWKMGLALTQKQARQFIAHGKIGLSNKKITAPSYWVLAGDEKNIGFIGKPVEIVSKKGTTTEEVTVSG